MEQRYNKNTKERRFKLGDKILALLPILVGHIKLDTLVPVQKTSDLNEL